MLLTMMVLPGKAVGQSKSSAGFNLTSKPTDGTTGTITGTASETWSWTATFSGTTYYGWTNSAWQVGASNKACTRLVFEATISGATISQIDVSCGTQSGKGTVNCTVGGSNFGTQGQSAGTGNNPNSYGTTPSFTGSANGKISVTINNTGTYISVKSITVTYSTGSTHTVTYNAGDGSGTVPTGNSYAPGVTVTVANRGGVTHETKGFRGWTDGVNIYDPGETFEMGSSDVTLTAVWTDKCTFAYNGNGNTGGAIPSSGFYSDYGAGAKITVLGNSGNLVKDGYAFEGWNIAADGSGTTTYKDGDVFTITSDITLFAKWRELSTYTLVTDADDIVPGKHYIIASSKTAGSATAMGAQGSTGNNRDAVDVTVSSVSAKTKITEADGLKEFVISGPETVIKNNETYYYYTIYDESINKYLYAASSSSNYLKNQDGITDNSQWTITFSNDAAVITAQGTNTRNIIRKNSSSAIFSCYASGQNAVYLYKKDTDSETTYYSPTSITIKDLNSESTPTTVLKNEILTLTGTISCTDPTKLVVKEGGQLILSGGSKDGVYATFQREVVGYGSSTDKDKYILLANPTTDDGGINPAFVTGMLTNDYDLYYFDESKNGVEWRNYKKETFNLVNGTGYLYANSVTKTLEFAGTVPTATSVSDIPLSYTAGNNFKGFNLIGNPMAVNITGMKINTTACPYYKLNDDGLFTTVNAANVSSNPVIVGQAFVVEASAKGDVLHLNPASKDANEYNDEVIRLEVSNSKYTDVAYICFGNSLPLTKINHLNDEAPMLYVHSESADRAVAVMNERSEVKSVNVNFEAKTMGTYTISGKAEKGNFSYMHLYDRLTGVDTDLLESDYTFIGSTTDAAGRFILRFEAIDNNSENESFAYQNGFDIIVNGEGELQIFDVMGRMVSTQQINGVERVNVKSQGVYIFRLNEKTQKIVVR